MTTALSAPIVKARRLQAWFRSPSGRQLQKWLSIAISLLVVLILVRAIEGIGWRQMLSVLPTNPLFYILFFASYYAQPLFDWIIYRRWWPIGWRSIAVFMKKRVLNEAVFSYSGETYLLMWASARFGLAYDPKAPPAPILGRGDGEGQDPRTSPFAAIKDVSIMSGLAGNSVTLIMLVLSLMLGAGPIVAETVDPGTLRSLTLAFSCVILLSLGIILFRKHVMSIPVRENVQLFWLHLARVLTVQGLVLVSWIVAMPEIPAQTWVLMAAMRMVMGRLPIPNKEILFAALAVKLTGDASIAVAALMAAQGALHLIGHGSAMLIASGLEATDTTDRNET